MKPIHLNTVIPFLFLAILFASCEKEISIKHKAQDIKLVVEAELDADSLANTVKLSKSVSVTNSNQFPQVSGAKVIVTNHQGYYEELVESEGGIYRTSNFTGMPGTTYRLLIQYEGKTYEAQSTIPAPVSLDTVLISRFNMAATEVTGVLPVFRDPTGQGNYYSFIQYVNNKKLKGSPVLSDELTDGKINMQPILNSTFKLVPGDVFRLDMRTIDKDSYQYLRSRTQTDNQQAAAPANPLTNLTGGALGYFSVFSSQSITLKITQ